MNTKVLLATRNDIEILIPLRKALWSHVDEPEHRNELESLFAQENFFALIAYNANEPVGFLEVSIKQHANGCRESPVLFLEGVWVAEKFRRKKVGEKLIRSVENIAKDKGIKAIASDTLINNSISQNAHLSWGFKEDERVVCYSKPVGIYH